MTAKWRKGRRAHFQLRTPRQPESEVLPDVSVSRVNPNFNFTLASRTTIKLRPNGTLTPERLALFRAASLIVIDEGPSLNKCVIGALIDCLREHSCNVRLLIVGDVQ